MSLAVEETVQIEGYKAPPCQCVVIDGVNGTVICFYPGISY